MNSWIENPEGGRDRGLRALGRAWVEVLVRPRRFFANGVAPGDQAPGLTFAAAVAAVFVTGWVATEPTVVPGIAESAALSAAVVVLLVTALAAPVGLHLTAALATVSLVIASLQIDDGLSFRERGGVSETVQVVAYASAPMALAGPPIPALRVVCGGYATLLLLLGVHAVHGTSPLRTLLAGLPAATFGYGIGYRVVAAARTLLG
ncbi:YIP1 family protein [Halorubrum aethiopicum]|uniref:YIP1 family protein n=1 Tax=Halorubrum aethiopicum TaxID=1758255 RepID=UPI0008358410|nr:YIP1 family protein [Halorubrum aethiopicum]